MRALVTGATGFTGGHLARHLRRRGETVRALVRPMTRAEEERAERRRALERWRAEAPILKPSASAPTTG